MGDRYRTENGVELRDDCEVCGKTHVVTRAMGMAIVGCPEMAKFPVTFVLIDDKKGLLKP